MRIEQLYLFPVKSLAPVPVNELRLTETGPEWDREWMVVDPEGKFATQRELPKMALIQPSLDAASLSLSLVKASDFVRIPLRTKGEPRQVKVWNDSLIGTDCGNESAAFLSAFLGRELRLVRFTDPRNKQGEHARSLKFVDDYPIHLASLSSLSDLNKRLPPGSSPLEVLRFRPNIVVGKTEPWEEDYWKAVTDGCHELRLGRACTRCSITTVDPKSGARSPEPLKTLAEFRRNAKNKIEFGIYLHSVPGTVLRVGQELEALYKRSCPTHLRALGDG